MPNRDIELKVGIFVFIGIVLLSIIIFSVGDFYSVKPGYHIKIRFGFANGVEVSAPVRLAGVQIGEVKDVKLVYNEKEGRTEVELDTWLKKDARVEADAKVYINMLGFLGEKYVEILPGTKDGAFIGEGDVLIGLDGVPTERLTRLAYEIALKLDKVVQGIDSIVNDEEVRESLKETLRNSRVLTDELTDVVEKLHRGEGTIGRLLTDSTLYDNFVEFSDDIKRHPWKLIHKVKEERAEGVESPPEAKVPAQKAGNRGFIQKKPEISN